MTASDFDALPQPTRRSSNATLAPPMIKAAPLSPTLSSSASLLAPPSPPMQFQLSTSTRTSSTTNKLFAVFFLILCTSAIGLMSISAQLHSYAMPSASAASTQLHTDTSPGLRKQVTANSPNANTNPSPTVTTKLPVTERWRRLGDLANYECVGWRATNDCLPTGAIDANRSKSCDESVDNGVSGYCEIRNKATGHMVHVMEMFCDSLRPDVTFKCADFADILSYGRRATAYVHDPAFSFAQCRQQLMTDQRAVGVAPIDPQIRTDPEQFFQRGIAIVVFDRVLESVYASVKSLREMGCVLPIELWFIREETDPHHVILKTLVQDHGAFLREIKDPRASRFYTKNYAVFYSAFDEVLLLDADNFAVRDPTYLFTTPAFLDSGALFWPDFWRFKKSIFNIQPTSFVWEVLDLDPVDMFEQESGQVLIDRRRHLAAMNAMMYYAFNPTLLESMRLVWGDKDLFRFAWLKTQSSFHMIQMPPGAAGTKLADRNVFCGVTMVQHDPSHHVLFLHRNQEKLASDNLRLVWQDLQQFKINSVAIDEYDVRGANGGRFFPGHKRCYGKDIYYEKAFTVRRIAELPFAGLEPRLLALVREAAVLVNASANGNAAAA